MKLGRNEPCWCGSGKKYKKCHLGRENQESLNPGHIHRQLAGFYNKKFCSVPESMKSKCSGKIIKAHSVSKSSSLKAIAKNGHVLSTFGSVRESKGNVLFEPVKVGINKASTFTGFCADHDKKLFSPIEDCEFQPNETNCFLVAYRALARELFVKLHSEEMFELVKDLDRGKSILRQYAVQKIGNHFSSNNDLTKSDLNYIKTHFDKMLISSSYEALQHYVFVLDSPPQVMASACFGPIIDFQGDIIQEFSKKHEEVPDYMIVNVFSSGSKGYIVLSWLSEHKESCIKFINSLYRSPSIEDSLTKFIFTTIENVYFSEVWWEHLSDSNRDEILSSIRQGVSQPTYNDSLITQSSFNTFAVSDSRMINY